MKEILKEINEILTNFIPLYYLAAVIVVITFILVIYVNHLNRKEKND